MCCMKTCVKKIIPLTAIIVALPLLSQAQGMADSVYSLNGVLDRLFNEMLPLCDRLTTVGRAIAGFGALWYIGVRVWKHLARAEAIDFFPLLRPFAIGMAIVLYPFLIGLLNGVLQPTVVATKAMGDDSYKAIVWHIEQEEKAIKETPPVTAYPGTQGDDGKYEQPDGTTNDKGLFSGLSGAFSFFNLKNAFKIFITSFVQTLYTAAGLCINAIRTFYLIILVIVGPLVLGLSVFDGFQNTLASWLARYVNVFMWLPVANIFGGICSKILENMMNLDQSFFGGLAYIIFMIISIVGYTTVPNVANYIIQAGGDDTLMHKVSILSGQAARAAGAAAGKS